MADVKARGRQVKSSIKLLEELKKRVYDMEKKKTALDINQLAVNGHDVMQIRGIPPSPEVGKILKRLLEMVIERPELNKRETLLKLIEEV
jgi:tRNA nucleotidyltransferase (CCA-adding enzyme)